MAGLASLAYVGRGIKATEAIEADQIVLEVPRSLFLTTSDTIRTHPELSKVFSDFTVWNTLSSLPDAILAIRLLFEKHSAPSSPWKAWIDALPKKYNSTLFWPTRELALLDAGNLYWITKKHRSQIEMEYAQVVRGTLVKRFPSIFKASVYTEDEYLWAMATVYSRATEAVVDGGHQRFIVPMMDMANHSFSAVVKHGYDAASNTFRLTSTGGIANGTQVFINYGPLGNSKLLHLYGFTTMNNPHDYVQLFLNMDPAAELYEKKQELLLENGIKPGQDFYLRLDELEHHFPLNILGTVRIQRLVEHDLDRVQYAFDLESIISEENEVYTLKALEEGLKSMFLAYKANYEEDLKLGEAVNEKTSKLSANELSALTIRMGDRHIIGKAGGYITTMTEAIRAHLQAKIDSGNTTPLVTPQ